MGLLTGGGGAAGTCRASFSTNGAPAPYSAACSIAKLRVGWIVGGWAFGVPRMVINRRFQSITDCPDPGASATDGAGAGVGPEVARAVGTAMPAATAAAARVTRTG